MRYGILKSSAVLALACAAGLTLGGCNRDYDNDGDADATTDQYGDTSGTGTTTEQPGGVLDMDKGADDSAIKDAVQAQLRNDARFEKVDIDIDDGVVTIDGTVANQADLDHVTQIVRQTPGVRDVKLDVDVETSAQDDLAPR